MDLPEFTTRAEALAAQAGLGPLRVRPQAPAHPVLPAQRTYVEIASPGPGPAEALVDLYHGSFAEAAAREAGFDELALLERALAHAAQHVAEERRAREAIGDDEALFETHARFRRGLLVPGGWYRRGERLAPSVWVVDLDLFVEVLLPSSAWEALRGGPLVLSILDDELEIELAPDATVDEVWTLPDCGLFEPAPGVGEEDVEALADDEELPGRFGDLHVVPYAF